MINTFWQGFEKQAGLSGFLGKTVAKIKTAPQSVGAFVHSIPAKATAVKNKVVSSIARNKKEFDTMQRRGLGSAGRKGEGIADKALDFSKNVQEGRLAKSLKQPTPARVQLDNKSKPGVLSKARDLASLGLLAGAGGAYMATKDKPDYEQQH